mmetsp:Transcript_89886/g.254724  ORF Transcript_89886/g.254724 Transcript_89886/m.254724 type:complete len:210 (+) Transcript_89886:79-708(+)
MGIVSILFLVLAAGAQPCSSAQLSRTPLPHVRDNPLSKFLPDGLRAFMDTPFCTAAQKVGILNATDDSGAAKADALTTAAEKAVACCTATEGDKVGCAEMAKKEYEKAAGEVGGSLGQRAMASVTTIGKVAFQILQFEWTSAAKAAASYWCGSSQSSYTKETAEAAKKIIAKATCLKEQPRHFILDAFLNGEEKPANGDHSGSIPTEGR